MVSKLRATEWLPPAVSCKACKQNFSMSEIAILTEKVEENLSIIQSKLTNSVTNQKKSEIWCKIADAVNAVGVARRMTTEVREKMEKFTRTSLEIFPSAWGGGGEMQYIIHYCTLPWSIFCSSILVQYQIHNTSEVTI